MSKSSLYRCHTCSKKYCVSKNNHDHRKCTAYHGCLEHPKAIEYFTKDIIIKIEKLKMMEDDHVLIGMDMCRAYDKVIQLFQEGI